MAGFRRAMTRYHKTNRPLHSVYIGQFIKERCRRAGIKKISGHSLRVGGAQTFAAAGISPVDMQIAGRWSSPSMPALYVRGQMAGKTAPSKTPGAPAGDAVPLGEGGVKVNDRQIKTDCSCGDFPGCINSVILNQQPTPMRVSTMALIATHNNDRQPPDDFELADHLWQALGAASQRDNC